MDYFAGLDISMDETHICVVDREGAVVYEGKSASTAEAIADKLSEAPVAIGSSSRLDAWRRSCSMG
jgi:transposase